MKQNDPIEQAVNCVKAAIPLTKSELRRLAAACQLRSLGRSGILFRVGDAVRPLAFVAVGLLRQFYTLKDGRTFTSAFVGQGQWVSSYDPAGNATPATTTVEAMAPTQVVTITQASMAALCQDDPRWERLTRHVAQNLVLARERRVRSLLCETPRQRYLRLCQERPDVMALVPLYKIATYVGVTPVTLSRIRAAMARPARARD